MNKDIEDLKSEMTQWRRDIHANPETAFEEFHTSNLVAEKLLEFGLEVYTGLASTGVVGTLKVGRGNKAYGFRADMDALHLQEENDFPHKSKNQGKMHACGHDGHTAMLLGAAKYLSTNAVFDGTLYFIFQPAEENEGGARVMIEDGLFENFPMQSIYGMHNYPDLPSGEFAIRSGPFLAACNSFHVTVHGKGCHAAIPHDGIDPILVGSHIVQAYQGLISRMKPAFEPAVLSVTQFHSGSALNIGPGEAVIQGSCRYFDKDFGVYIEGKLQKIADDICSAFGATCSFTYIRQYPPLVNAADEVKEAVDAAVSLVGAERVYADTDPVMGSEDFAFMLQEKPGAYIFIGAGIRPGEQSGPPCTLHNPGYDFNDGILTLGASYWISLAEKLMPVSEDILSR